LLGKLLAGGVAGSAAGARLANRLPGAKLRHYLLCALAALGAVLAARSAWAILRVV